MLALALRQGVAVVRPRVPVGARAVPRLAHGVRTAARPAQPRDHTAAAAGGLACPSLLARVGGAFCAAVASTVASTVASLPLAECAPSSTLSADGVLDLFKAEYLTECGVGGFAGYAAGFALKRAAQVVIFTTGCLFIGMQVMANHGYVTVHWDKIDKDWRGRLDTDGDGRVTHKDMHGQYEQLVKVLESGVPGAAGFSAGFILGLRS
ncbi:hypothetical protein KFE25_011457 [Diacronema lutheri]|uniref:EF-hand domain-containing protein n=1 Tax=Diacronema lutheri TaxID=2081491 RepID=A0A8J5XGT1_DIALT|nr:hypothetical protein KFE25_011457 [Diacronema lutheri]